MADNTQRTLTPDESQLSKTISELRVANPSLGIPKLHALLLQNNPTWLVSEKRMRKILQSNQRRYPSSQINPFLRVNKWTNKVEVKVFDSIKGKGLVATQAISAEQAIWKEDPFALAAEWDIYDLQTKSACCAHCSTPLSFASSPMPCPHSCSAVFCNRLCLSRAQTRFGHNLLCAAANPPSAALLSFARRMEWQALHALARCAARLLGNTGHSEDESKEDWALYSGLAVLGMEDRYKHAKEDGLGDAPEPDRETWKKAFDLFIQTFHDPSDAQAKKRLNKVLGPRWVKSQGKEGHWKQVHDEFLTYEGFLRGLGRMSLNLEAHGGLYALHSHVNHCCEPNVSVRHLDQKTALSRITVIAKRDIAPGEELLITYVNPELNVNKRRERLSEWGFGKCSCHRCSREEKEQVENGEEKDETDDLSRELKAGLGLS